LVLQNTLMADSICPIPIMQFHVQHNGQQSGPHTLEEVRAQLANRTFQPTDLAWHEGLTGWQPLSAISELAGSFPQAVAAKTSGLAIASLVLGILSMLLCGLTWIPAVICGHMSLSRIKKSFGTLSGKGMAIAGLVTGYVSILLFIPLLASMAIPASVGVIDKAKAAQSMNNARQIYLGCKLYASDNDGKFPDNLEQLIPQYLPDRRVFVCPMSTDKTSIGFDYFSGFTDTSDPGKILLQSKATTRRHERVIVRVDGSAQLQRE